MTTRWISPRVRGWITISKLIVMHTIRKHILALSALSLLLLPSCHKMVDAVVEQPSEIVFGANFVEDLFEEETKTTAVNTDGLGSFYVCATSDAKTPVQVSGSDYIYNTLFSRIGVTEFKGGKYWPAPSAYTGWQFYASNVQMVANGTDNPYVNVPDNSVDVVCSRMASVTRAAKNTFTFEHIFSRVGTVVVTAAADFTISDVKIWIEEFKNGGVYDMYSGTWTSTNGIGDVDIYDSATVGSSANDLYLCPGTYTFHAVWTATQGSTVKNYSASVTKTLSKGFLNNFSVELGGTSDMIQFTILVKPWVYNPEKTYNVVDYTI